MACTGEAGAMEGGGWLWDVLWPWFEIRDRRHSRMSAWVIDGGPFCQNWKTGGESSISGESQELICSGQSLRSY